MKKIMKTYSTDNLLLEYIEISNLRTETIIENTVKDILNLDLITNVPLKDVIKTFPDLFILLDSHYESYRGNKDIYSILDQKIIEIKHISNTSLDNYNIELSVKYPTITVFQDAVNSLKTNPIVLNLSHILKEYYNPL